VARSYVHRDAVPIVEGSREIGAFLNVPVVAPLWLARESWRVDEIVENRR
jgi:hypothetical protein